MSKSKSLSESAAEILAASLGSAAKEPPTGGNAAVDLGGETVSSEPDAFGAKASALAKEAPKPGQAGAPAEGAKSLEAKPKKPVDKAADGSEDGDEVAELAKEEVEDESEQELTEEEMEEYINSLSEDELEALATELETLEEEEDCDDCDEDEDEDEDEEETEASETKEEVELSAEQIAEARKASLKQLVANNMGSCKEDIDALFSGESLSDEFKTKATTIFEAAVRSRVDAIVDKVATENEANLETTVKEIESNLTDQVDEYMNYVVEQWLEDNKVAVDSGLRTEIAEDFMAGLKNLFLEHYIEVPEDKADLVEELAAKVAAADEAVEAQKKINEELTKKLNESVAQEVLRKICDGLTELQVSKIKALAEGVEFTTEGEYSQKLAVIRENYFPSGKLKGEAPQTVVETDGGSGEVTDRMDRYVNAITKQLPK